LLQQIDLIQLILHLGDQVDLIGKLRLEYLMKKEEKKGGRR